MKVDVGVDVDQCVVRYENEVRMTDVGHASLAPMLSLVIRFAQGTVVQDRPASLKIFTEV